MMNAGIDYGVRVIRAYEQRRVGQVFYPPGALRDALVKRGFVERCTAAVEQSAPDDDDGQLALRQTKRAKR